LEWACKWPFEGPRSDQGIISAQIETEKALDLRVEAMMKAFRNLIYE